MEPRSRIEVMFLWIFLIVILTGNISGASVSLTPDWEKISGQTLPDVVFTDAAEREVRLSDYEHMVLILHPMFTHCPSTCTIVASQLSAAIQGLSTQERSKLRILSFSFDPAETPEGLAKFEKMFSADVSFWKVVRARPERIQEMLTALDFRTLQLAPSNYEHPNLVFLASSDRVLRDYIFGSDLTSERLSRSLRTLQSGGSDLLKFQSHVFPLAVIGLFISAFVVAHQLSRARRQVR